MITINSLLKRNLLRFIESNYFRLLCLWLFCLFLDLLWITTHSSPPKWDQGYHLSQLYTFADTLKIIDLFNHNWWHNIWAISDNYRGPLTYILSSPFILIFGKSYSTAILSNSLFNLVLILSTFHLGKLIKDSETGLWAALICASSPAFLHQRTDY